MNNPLQLARNGNCVRLRKLILESKSAVLNAATEFGDTVLIIASRNGYDICVSDLIQAGANVNTTNTDGETALMVASGNGHIKSVKALITAGAEVNIKDSSGDTALIVASLNGRLSCVKYLIESGADASITNNDNNTALDYANRERYKKIINILKLALSKNSDMPGGSRKRKSSSTRKLTKRKSAKSISSNRKSAKRK